MKFNFMIAVLLICNKILFNDKIGQEKTLSCECNEICINVYVKNIYNLFIIKNNDY